MIQSHVINIDGTFAGAAVRTAGTLRFIAVDPRVEDLDQSEWPSLADVNRVVGHLFRTGRFPASSASLHLPDPPRSSVY
jgi:hypothetical protein